MNILPVTPRRTPSDGIFGRSGRKGLPTILEPSTAYGTSSRPGIARCPVWSMVSGNSPVCKARSREPPSSDERRVEADKLCLRLPLSILRYATATHGTGGHIVSTTLSPTLLALRSPDFCRTGLNLSYLMRSTRPGKKRDVSSDCHFVGLTLSADS